MHRLGPARLYLSCLIAPMLITYSLSGLRPWTIPQFTTAEMDHRHQIDFSAFHLGDGLDAAGNSALSPLLFQGASVVMALLLLEVVILVLISAFSQQSGLRALISLIVGIMVPFLRGLWH